MSAYVIVEFTVKDPDVYCEKYAGNAGKTAREHGAEVLANSNWEILDGAPMLSSGVIVQFPAHETALRWYNSPDGSYFADRKYDRNLAFGQVKYIGALWMARLARQASRFLGPRRSGCAAQSARRRPAPKVLLHAFPVLGDPARPVPRRSGLPASSGGLTQGCRRFQVVIEVQELARPSFGPVRQLNVDRMAHVVRQVRFVLEDHRHQVLVPAGTVCRHQAYEPEARASGRCRLRTSPPGLSSAWSVSLKSVVNRHRTTCCRAIA